MRGKREHPASLMPTHKRGSCSPEMLTPAAQYIRMSTEHQQYSFDNQKDAIALYAEQHGFAIVRTYDDAAKSGVVLKGRTGLKRLLRDVVSGSVSYKAILVYDISRWGRFQDADKAAHYEFLCKHAGVPIHYCAETFGNEREHRRHDDEGAQADYGR